MFFISIFEPGLGSTEVLPNQILLCYSKQRSTYGPMRFDKHGQIRYEKTSPISQKNQDELLRMPSTTAVQTKKHNII